MTSSDVIEIETAVVLLVTLGRISAPTQELCIAKKIENLVFDILLPKAKPNAIGVFYRPLHQAEFMDSVIYFIINLFQSARYILKGKRSTISQGSVDTMISRYKKVGQIYPLKQLIRCRTPITCNTSTLIDPILTSSTEKILQSGIIYCGISDHQLIFVQEMWKELNSISITMCYQDQWRINLSIYLSKVCEK